MYSRRECLLPNMDGIVLSKNRENCGQICILLLQLFLQVILQNWHYSILAKQCQTILICIFT